MNGYGIIESVFQDDIHPDVIELDSERLNAMNNGNMSQEDILELVKENLESQYC